MPNGREVVYIDLHVYFIGLFGSELIGTLTNVGGDVCSLILLVVRPVSTILRMVTGNPQLADRSLIIA